MARIFRCFYAKGLIVGRTMDRTKLFSCLALALCAFICLSSCAKSGSNLDEVFSQLEIASDDESETESEAIVEHIYVIIPDGCSGELSLKARELADKIKEKTGLLTSLKYDNELKRAPDGSCEILLGNTDRLASKNAIDVLRKDEYLCHWDNGAIVICGRSDSATIVAVEKFMSEILPSATKYSIMHSGAHLEYKCEYDIKDITLNGYDLYDYTLIYPASNKYFEKDMAIMLRDAINARSGYFLDVISDEEITDKTVRVLSVSAQQKQNAIVPYEYGVAIVGDNSYSLSLAVDRFIDDIDGSNKDGVVDLKYDKIAEIASVDTSFESVLCFVKENTQKPISPFKSLMELFNDDKTGIYFVGNPDEYLITDIKANIASHLKLNEVEIGERKVLIVYNEQKIKKIDIFVSEDKRYITTSVDTAFGEGLFFIYIISGEIPTVERNAIVLCEGCDTVKNESLSFVANASGEIPSGSIKCALACEKNVIVSDADKIVRNDEDLIAFNLTTKIALSNAFLDNSLK